MEFPFVQSALRKTVGPWVCSLTVAAALFASACSSTIARDDLVGTYRLTTEFGSERLTLKPDGAYEQLIRLNSGREFTNTGEWKDSSSGEDQPTVVRLEGKVHWLRFVPLELSESFQTADAIHPAVRWFGRIELVVDPDGGLSYIKEE